MFCIVAFLVIAVMAAMEVAAFVLLFRRVLPVHEAHLAAIREAWETLVAVTQPLALNVDNLLARVDALEHRNVG